MDELIKLVTTKTGISEDQARSAVNTVLEFVKGKLPAALASQIDNVVGGGSGASDTGGDIAAKIGGLLG